MNMLEAVANEREHNTKIYKAATDEHKANALSADIMAHAKILITSDNLGKVDFNNIEDVKARTYAYFEACAKSGAFPSVMGLAVHGFGISRQALNQYLLRNPGDISTQFINMAKDSIADILTNESLYNNANSIQAIFQLKNHFDHSDRVEIQPVNEVSPHGETMAALIETAKYLPD